MLQEKYKYIVVGAGLAGYHAIGGIRTLDKDGSLLLAGSEKYLPYDRPPLTKKLWFGKKKVEEIFVCQQQYFTDNNIDLILDTTAVKLDAANKVITFKDGNEYQYEKLLLATGGAPRKLDIEGGNLNEIYYYRYLDDFIKLKSQVSSETKAMVIGGGFIGSEIAAALNINQADVTMLVKETYMVERIFPKPLGNAIMNEYVRRGVKILTEDMPVSITKQGKYLITRTKNGREIMSDVVVAGIGIEPETKLAKSAALTVENGIVVNEYLQSSSPDVYAAGDNAYFPYQALGKNTRIEHWDNAINQGKMAGMNMAGAHTAYAYMPYFFSDLFDFGYEAVGQINSRLETFADWQKENDTGVIYYLESGKVCGAMMCNVWNKVDAARELIKGNKHLTAAELQGAIK